ncbi:unnamed protein product [Orchesella dallaii]|uniref:Uncharacterized protein n=1 Tax=Orchesella dallaii TaxID=48710 RepID=A0ABP1RTC0_9HEXA
MHHGVNFVLWWRHLCKESLLYTNLTPFSSGVRSSWRHSDCQSINWAEWVGKTSDEKAIHVMKEMFPSVKKLDITGNIVVIFYTFMILQAVAFAIFAVEYLCSIKIFGVHKKQTQSGFFDSDQFSKSTMETLNKHRAISNASNTDQRAGLPICEFQPVQKTITEIRIDGANLNVSIEGECNTYIDPTDEAYDGKISPSDHLLSQQTPNNLMMSVKSDEAMDNEETNNESSDFSEVDLENVEKTG